MKQLVSVSFLIIFASVGIIGCDDTEIPQVKGVLLNLNTLEPMYDELVVINSASDIKFNFSADRIIEIEYVDLKIDSTLTDAKGAFVFNIDKKRNKYLLEMGDETLISSTYKSPRTGFPATVHHGYDTLIAGAKTSVIIHQIDEDINDEKTTSVEITYNTIPISILTPRPITFSTPNDLQNYTRELNMFWDFNHQISLTKKISENGTVQLTEPETFVMEKGGSKVIEIRY